MAQEVTTETLMPTIVPVGRRESSPHPLLPLPSGLVKCQCRDWRQRA
jgi:hypothetical protein